jgi:hypothetical protein
MEISMIQDLSRTTYTCGSGTIGILNPFYGVTSTVVFDVAQRIVRWLCQKISFKPGDKLLSQLTLGALGLLVMSAFSISVLNLCGLANPFNILLFLITSIATTILTLLIVERNHP